MDPIETLRLIRRAALVINMLAQVEDPTDAQRNEMLDQGEALAEHFANLDVWLSKGGASPWQPSIADAIPFWNDWIIPEQK